MVYSPAEDSFLILKEIHNFSSGRVLDMGTGTGVLGIEAAKTADSVVCADINASALRVAKLNSKGAKNIHFVQSDLFSNISGEFDLIIFNPPYLPLDLREPADSSLETTGGEKGYELIEKFFSYVTSYLKENGKILLLFSSLTGKEKVHSILEDRGYNYQKLSEESMFEEVLFVYIVEKSSILNIMEDRGITNVGKLAKGHRGKVYVGDLDGKKIALKKQREDIDVTTSVQNEARWLKLLNRKGIGPKLLFSHDDYFAYEFVKGEFIPKFILENSKQNIKKVLIDVLKQCFVMDSRGITKEEMHKPYKHVIIGKKAELIDSSSSKTNRISKTPKVVLIDFERTHATEKPQNVTQFCQYILSKKISDILLGKGFKINRNSLITTAQIYKRDLNKKNFEKIMGLVK